MLAQVAAISTDPLTFLLRTRREYGPIVQFPLPRPPTYFVDDPAAIRAVLTGGPGIDKDTPQYRALRRVTGAGLLVANDDEWRRQRPAVQPAFHTSASQQLIDDTRAATQRLVTRWDQAPAGALVDVQEAMLGLALDAVVRHLFGADLVAVGTASAGVTTQDGGSSAAAISAALDAVVGSILPPQSALRWLPTPMRSRHRAAMRALESAVAQWIAVSPSPGDRSTGNLLAILWAAYPDNPRAVRDQVFTFLIAGHETMATALTWTIGLLAHHPAEQDRAAAGAEGNVADEIDACLCEALRLYPPAWMITRSVDAPTTLGGREIPAGALLIISPWVRHRDERAWPDPEAFRPARFGDQPLRSARKLTVRGDYLPFGAGQRLCIGRDMALLQARTVLGMLLARYQFDPAEAALPAAEAGVTAGPATGLRVRIRPREP